MLLRSRSLTLTLITTACALAACTGQHQDTDSPLLRSVSCDDNRVACNPVCTLDKPLDSCPKDAWPTWYKFNEQELFQLINLSRTVELTCTTNGKVTGFAASRTTLTRDPNLDQAARFHSLMMAQYHHFDHDWSTADQVPVGSAAWNSFSQRIEVSGYGKATAAENLAFGDTSAQSTFDSWMSSDAGDCENLMNADFKNIGVGFAHTTDTKSSDAYFWTVVIAAPPVK